MSDDAQKEHAAAVVAYREALARLQEAKRHIPPSPRDLRNQRQREERRRKREEEMRQYEKWAALREANPDAPVIDQQAVNRRAIGLFAHRIRLPVSYRIVGPTKETDRDE